MTPQLYRQIVTRAFVATGKDGGPGLVEYIDRLERGFLYLDKELQGRKRVRSRSQIQRAMMEHDTR